MSFSSESNWPFPSHFRTFVGGMGPTYSVEWVDGAAHYTFRENRIDPHPRLFERLDVHIGKWLDFWRFVRPLQPERWSRSYRNMDILDGTVWGIELGLVGGESEPDLSVESSGSNRYPSLQVDQVESGADPGSDDSTEVWEMWCAAVAALVERPFA